MKIINKRSILLTAFILAAAYSMGQSYLALRPSIGIQRNFTKVVNDENSAPEFINNTYEEGAEFGLWLEYVNDEYSYSAGVKYGYIGFSSGIGESRNIIGTTPSGPSSFNSLFSFPIKFSKSFKQISLIPFKVIKQEESFAVSFAEQKENKRYLLVFRPVLFGGISYNYLPKSVPERDTSTRALNNFDMQIVESVNTRHGLSVFIGGTLQFRHKRKDLLAITLYYSKGLTTMINADLQYTLNNKSYETALSLKGTVIGANISFPVRLITFR